MGDHAAEDGVNQRGPHQIAGDRESRAEQMQRSLFGKIHRMTTNEQKLTIEFRTPVPIVSV